MEIILSSENHESLFLTPDDLPLFLEGKGLSGFIGEALKQLVHLQLLPSFVTKTGEAVFLVNDLLAFVEVIRHLAISPDASREIVDFFVRGELQVIQPSTNTTIYLPSSRPLRPVLYPAIRNLLEIERTSSSPENTGSRLHMGFVGDAHVSTTSRAVGEMVSAQRGRQLQVESLQKTDFARSASYMGSKRGLTGLLVESCHSVLPDNGNVLDLMCGSGIAAAAFNRFWKTYASDAQAFCRGLAKVQGGGFSRYKASHLLTELLPVARRHFGDLAPMVRSFLDEEDRFFHSETDTFVLDAYQQLTRTFPTISNLLASADWNPTQLVATRSIDPRIYPFCLFTAYFANIYFGIRQCIEIDSLRYAIESLNDSELQSWALGALTATLSRVGTTYGGHFAQPKFHPAKDLTLRNLVVVLEQRSISVFHEFSIRLLSLAEQSEGSVRPISILSGPWQPALEEFSKAVGSAPALVYVDAPYTRDEYSRYYHVLETAVNYSYPPAFGSGVVPPRGPVPHGRFQSAFFTKSATTAESLFGDIISAILNKGYVCAWSYAHPALANIPAVLQQVRRNMSFESHSFSVPYRHKAHGSVGSKPVTEYLLLLRPT
jgi:adenine-specific DNA-methyltransferase